MYSVTKRIGMIKQPYGGYIPRKQFAEVQLDDGIKLHEDENIHASLVGIAVDYLTRFMTGTEIEEAFTISLRGSVCLDLFTRNINHENAKNAVALLSLIQGLDTKSVICACKLAGYDVCYRAGIQGYKPIEEINPNGNTVENIMTMVKRSIDFWDEHGPIVKDGFTFEGGYTNTISSGDGDYLTKDTLWDFKVSKNEITSKHTLQLLVYYILGTRSIHQEFEKIKRLGIYNPRMNKIYTIEIDKISPTIIDDVSRDVIGY